MKRRAIGKQCFVILGLCLVLGAMAKAQEEPTMGLGKKLPPGLLKTIPVDAEASETFTDPRPVVELLADPKLPNWTPKAFPKSDTLREMAKNTIFRRTIWNLEFSFKPLRMLEVDIPQPSGKMQRKNIWYMVYKVRNNGYHLGIKTDTDQWEHKTYGVERVNQNIYFFPQFVLRANVRKPGAAGDGVDNYVAKEYLDRIIPAAMKPIADRERVGVLLHDSVSISKVAIPVSDDKVDRSVWGVMIWEDVDPTMNFISIFAQGLTNAYKFDDPDGAFKAGDPPATGRVFTQKNLQLNFWRPGDAVQLHEDEIRFGLPLTTDAARQEEIFQLYGVDSPVDYQWVYR